MTTIENAGALAFALGLICAGCSDAPAEPVPARSHVDQALTAPYVIASPNPCSAGDGDACTTLISWDAGAAAKARIRVSVDGNPPTNVACGDSTGSISVPWIQEDREYRFTLHPLPSCSASLPAEAAAVTVHGARAVVQVNGTGLWHNGQPFRSFGMNKLDLFHQFLGTADADVSQALSAMDAAQASGVDVLKFIGAPLWPSDLNEWSSDPTSYWAAFSTLVTAAEARNIQLVPVLWWNEFVFADAQSTPEPLGAMFDVSNPSPARDQLLAYAQDFATRFGGSKTILYWELTNSLNIRADTDYGNSPQAWVNTPQTPASRTQADNFTTSAMLDVLTLLAQTIKNADPLHPIASGFAAPKATATDLRQNPEWTGVPAEADTVQEMEAHIALLHPDPIDLVSVQVFNAPSSPFLPHLPGHDVFGAAGQFDPGVFALYKAAADDLGKPLVVSAFNDSAPPLAGDARGNFLRRGLLELLELGVPLAFVTGWASYADFGAGLQPWPFNIEPDPGNTLMTDLVAFFGDASTWARTERVGTAELESELSNGDFEAHSGAGSLPTGWSATTGSGSVGIDTVAAPFEGAASVRVDTGSGASPVALTSDPFEVIGLDRLVLSAAVTYPATPTANVRMEIVPYDPGGVELPGGTVGATLDPAMGGGTRVEVLRADLDAETASVAVRFQVGGTSGLVVHVDDVRVLRFAQPGEGCPQGNGAADTCYAGCPCQWGHGDCDSDEDCVAGLVCGNNNADDFGLYTWYEVCVPAHCNNNVQDVAEGETGVDTGAPCGEPPVAFSLATDVGFVGTTNSETGEHLNFTKQHTSVISMFSPEMLAGNDDAARAPLRRFAGPRKTYAQYRAMLEGGTQAERDWLAVLDDYKRRAGGHPIFLTSELQANRHPGFGPVTLPKPLEPSGGYPDYLADYPHYFKQTKQLLDFDCCGCDITECAWNQPSTCSHDACKGSPSCGPPVEVPTFQRPESREAIANLALFYVEHFEPERYAFFPELNLTYFQVTGLSREMFAGQRPPVIADEWDGIVATYAEVMTAMKQHHPTVRAFPTWQWDALTANQGVLNGTEWIVNSVYAAAAYDELALTTYPAGWHVEPPPVPPPPPPPEAECPPLDFILAESGNFSELMSLEMPAGYNYFTQALDPGKIASSAASPPAPLVIAEAGWPGVVDQGANYAQFLDWILTDVSPGMLISFFGIDPRYSAPFWPDPPHCGWTRVPMGLVQGLEHGLRPKQALHVFDREIYGLSGPYPDLDSDGDGYPDANDTCPYVANPNDQGVGPDGDSVGDDCDNCTAVYNPLQTDGDLDGYGNACDGDFGGDGLADEGDQTELGDAIAAWTSSCDPDALKYDFQESPDGRIHLDSADLAAFAPLLNQPVGPSGWACAGQTSPCPRIDCLTNSQGCPAP